MRKAHRWPLLSLLLFVSVQAANMPPVVDAGSNTEYPSGQSLIYLEGTVSDDATPTDSLIVEWRQISGPAHADITSPTTLISLVVFPHLGVYTFVLEAHDGLLSSVDTTVVTIRESLPFTVLAPANFAQVEIGTPYTIRWQREPKVPCQVYYSTDDGLSYHEITVSGAVASGQVVWNVDPEFVAGTRGYILIRKYQTPDDTTGGSFTLVDHPPQQTRRGILASSHAPIRVSVDKAGWLRVANGGARSGDATIAVHDPGGKTLAAARVGEAPTVAVGARGAVGPMIYRIVLDGETIQSGMFVEAGR